ncbi:non-ribosomal peptide synthetase [Pyxidicoccus parkwayensis]|uniref:Non-ribosomal peptide synthetase n=1 Tax=Pyxidicoccus parkwayensis TaxID=2813578 RepID=A0ABX7P8I3_9BACT|nr:non-ribosomal peptide synthetase [Pyxidicoccus parkwaysis]QSQ26736.1 non-ribosomal peptide synthetase [Pyxidicoccus parkwaysis]
MPQRFIPPRDAYELRVSRLWADHLHRAAIDLGMKDDFFELGGDRARAEAVLAETSARFDTPLSIEAFLQEPTIERLGCLLRAKSRKLNEQPLVPLQPHGSKRPFFFLPGGEGTTLNSHALARWMGPEQPLYGLQTRGLYGTRPPFTRVEELAADHIESMRAVQPRGPYLLGGHCSGGTVALEMALQLQRSGERVAVLAVLDAWSPAILRQRMPNETFLDDLVEFYSIVAAGFRYWYDVDIGLKSDELRTLGPQQRIAHFMDLARKHGAYPPDEPDERIERILALYRAASYSGYAPAERFQGPITFLRATDSKFCETLTEGWEDVSTQPLRLRMVEGNHVSLLTEPHVERVANELRAAIAEAQVS